MARPIASQKRTDGSNSTKLLQLVHIPLLLAYSGSSPATDGNVRVRLTQIVDFWIGVPFCFLFGIVNRLLMLLGPRKTRNPSKILFIEISEMGSAIIAYPSLYLANTIGRESGERNDLYFLVFEKNRESVELLKVIPRENIITIPDNSFAAFAVGAFKALRKVRQLGIDTVVDMELFSRFTALFSFATGAVNRVGFHNYTAEGLYRGKLLTHAVFYNPHQHMAKNFLALVRSLEAANKETPLLKENVEGFLRPLPKFTPEAPDEVRVKGLLLEQRPDLSASDKIVVINPDPGEALPIRGWPLEYFVRAVSFMAEKDPTLVFVVIGLGRSKPYADAIRPAAPHGRFIDLTGKTETLAEVVTLLRLSHVLLGNDSGPAHFAALTDIFAVTLFGPETPSLYGPVSEKAINVFSGFACAPCLSAANHRHSICRSGECLKSIRPEAVAAQVLSVLGHSSIIQGMQDEVSLPVQ